MKPAPLDDRGWWPEDSGSIAAGFSSRWLASYSSADGSQIRPGRNRLTGSGPIRGMPVVAALFRDRSNARHVRHAGDRFLDQVEFMKYSLTRDQ